MYSDTSSLLDMYFANIITHSVACLFIPLMEFFEERMFSI